MEIAPIPFNKPYLSGNETKYLNDAVQKGHISGNGAYTKLCHTFFQEKWGFKKCLLTTSCTDALEMCALLINIQPGDEVIVPSFTFVSSALAFARQGATLKFVDSADDHPNLNVKQIEALISPRTKAIIVVHYAGMSCNMDAILQIKEKYNLILIEDAAQAINSYYKNKPLGSIGDLGCFSFHETKNIQCGEGGMLVINNKKYMERAEIIWEKGTDRAKFFRGEINKYGWVDLGSSFLMSDLLAAFLYAQLENLYEIQDKRIRIWNQYFESLKDLANEGKLKLPKIPSNATNNGHLFYILCKDLNERSSLIKYLSKKGVHAVFHYQSLHRSDYMKKIQSPQKLPKSDYFENCLLRLPLYYELSIKEVEKITDAIKTFYQ